jgi:hypothetical protein
MKNILIPLLILASLIGFIYFFIEMLPNLKQECNAVDTSIISPLADSTVLAILGISCTAFFSWIFHKLDQRLKTNWLFKLSVTLVFVVGMPMFILEAWCLYEYCGEISSIEFIKWKLQ